MGSTDRPRNGQDAVIEMGGLVLRPGDRIGSYIYERPIATGGMAHVLLARDPSDRPVALKVLKASRMASGLGRFRREFRALSRLKHPNVIRVEALGDVHGHPYIAMEYVEGEDLHQAIRNFRYLPDEERWRRCESILADLAQALAHIHKKGLVHRDLKPSNVLIDGDGRCRLTDFGIVKDLDPSSSDPFVSTTLVGTWAYASPEQISGAAIDHRSDIYSLGVILYAMLTGRRPFVARDMAGYLEAHRERAPRPPRQLNPAIPAHLEAICLRMLEKAPRDRYQSAREILDELRGGEPEAPETSEEVRWEPPLVGRDAEQDRLRDAVSALTRGEGGVVLLEGPEGSGRSRLLRHALDFARLIGIPVHDARMTSGSGAFSALVSLSEAIGRELGPRAPRELAEGLAAFVRGQGRIAGDLRYALYDGVREALARLTENGPLVLAIDDMHHAPAPLAELVLYLARALVVREAAPMLLIVTARNDLPAPVLEPFRDPATFGERRTRIELGPLDLDAVRALVATVVGEDRPGLAERIHRESDGNPFFACELARAALRGRPATDDDATREVPPEGHADLARVVRERLGARDAGERAILELVAAAGPLDVDTLLDALTTDEERALDRIDRVTAAGLLVERRVGMQAHLDFAQRRLAEVVYRDLAPARRAAAHRRLAVALESRYADNPLFAERIGEHYRRAGDAARAWTFLGLAARSLAERDLLGEAWAVAERAAGIEEEARRELPESTFAGARLAFLDVRAATLYNRGSWAEAAAALAALRDAALALGDDALGARAGLDRATCLWRLGREDDARNLAEGVLASARSRHDRVAIIDALHRLAAFAWEKGDLATCEALAQEGLLSASGPDVALARAEILMALTAVQASQGQLAAATRGLVEAEGILRDHSRKKTRAVVLANLAELYAWQGRLGPAWEAASEALGLARDVLHREGEAFAHQVRGLVLLEAGDLAGAGEDVAQAIAIAEQTGIASDLVAALYLQGRVALNLGDAERAAGLLRAGLGAARRADPERYAPALEASLAQALARLDESDEAERLLDGLVGGVDGLPVPRRAQVQVLAGAAWLALDEPDEALAPLRDAARLAQVRNLRGWALRARLLLARVAEGDEAERARREARGIARGMLAALPPELARPFRNQPGVRELLDDRPGSGGA